MPHIPDEHDFDIQKPRLSQKKTRDISRWRNQMENKSVDLRSYAPKPDLEATLPHVPDVPAVQIPPQLKEAPTPHNIHTEKEISRDDILRELEQIEQQHVEIHEAMSAYAPPAQVQLEPRYSPWSSIEDDRTLSALSLFTSVRHPAAQFIPDATYAPLSKRMHKKRSRSLRISRISVRNAAMLLVPLVLGILVWQRSQGVEERIAPQVLDAYGNLEQAKADLTALHFSQASSEFSFAEEKFSDAQNTTESVGGALLAQALAAAPIPNKARSGIRLIAAGKEFSRAGADVSHAAFLLISSNRGATSDSFSSVFSEAMREISDAQTQITQAQGDMALVRIEDIPDGYRAQFSDSLARLNDANSIFQSFGPLSQALMTFAGLPTGQAGMQGEKTYLLLFQNPAEIRATGGFLGTYGVLKLDQGQIKSITADGTYDADGQLTANVVPPYPIQYISTGWSMHDANWFFDFPTSMQKVQWFYEKTGGETTDGVIALTPHLIENLLTITGPIEMPAYNTTLTADNFEDIVQQQVEAQYDKTQNKPKQILADLMPLLFSRVQSALPSRAGDIAQILMRNLQEKDILLYSRDQNVEWVFDAQGWSGRVTPPTSQGAQDVQDLLGVVQTNLGGYKTDRMIRTIMQTATMLGADGAIQRTITITRTHQGGKSVYDWYNKPNVDYMRIYVPLGSHFVGATGFSPQPAIPSFDYQKNNFSPDSTVQATGLGQQKDGASNTDIFQESGTQVFGNWLILNPGETKSVQVTYTLPVSSSAPLSYTLNLFSQSGVKPVLSISLDVSQAGTISHCSQGSYNSQSMTLQKAAFSTDTKVTCVVGH